MTTSSSSSSPRGRPKRPRRKFTPEFKANAVAMVLETGRPIAHVAEDLGIWESSLGLWVKQARIDAGEAPGTTTADQQRIAKLEAEVRQLRQERDLLKRTTAFWVKESTP